MNQNYEKYYVPAQSPWPIVGAIAMFLIAVGAGLTVMQASSEASGAQYVLYLGLAILFYMLFSWFKNVIEESGNASRMVLSG